MIARIWHGRVRANDLHDYAGYVASTGIQEYKATPGNRGAFLLAKTEGDVAHVVTLSFWESLDAIRAFAGPDATLARYYPLDERYLLEFPERVEHFEIFSS